jgi:methionine synthase II (cobalamin-independent)
VCKKCGIKRGLVAGFISSRSLNNFTPSDQPQGQVEKTLETLVFFIFCDLIGDCPTNQIKSSCYIGRLVVKLVLNFYSLLSYTRATMAPFRAEHMGSLLRPENLLEVRETIREKGISEEEAGLPAVEKAAVGDVVKLQTDLGFKAVTSGEYVRTRFWGLMWDEFQGTTRLQDAEASMFRLYHPDVVSLIEKDRKVMPGDSVIAGAKLTHDETKSASNLHELKLVQAFVPKEDWKNIKLTMITPAWFHMRYKQGRAYTPEAYANDADYFKDVAKVYQDELDMLYKAGLRNVQFDDPGLACTLLHLLPKVYTPPYGD